MKILKIELQNINSLKSDKPIVIDFESDIFKDTGLFAITGTTGSGKTTILDAITIALYRKVPRFHKSQGTLFDVISYGAKDAFCRITFENNQKVYEAYWGGRVAKSSGKKLKNPLEEVSLKNLTDQTILATQKTKMLEAVEAVTQLNYEQFLRSVMLAQGEFAAFLSAKASEKGKLLEQITGEEIYKRIGEQILWRRSQEEEKLNDLIKSLNQTDILSDEEKTTYQKRERELKIEIQALNKELNTIKKIEKWYKDYSNLIYKQQQILKDEEAFQKYVETHQKELELLSVNDEAEPHKPLIDNILKDNESLKIKTQETEKLYAELKKLEPEIQELLRQETILTKQVAEAKAVFKEWLPKFDELSRLETNIKNRQTEQDKIKKNLSEIEIKIVDFQNVKNDLAIKLKSQQKKLIELTTYVEQQKYLEEVDEQLTGWTSHLTDLKNQSLQIEQLQQAITQKKEEVENSRKIMSEKESELKMLIESIKSYETQIRHIENELKLHDVARLIKEKDRQQAIVEKWKKYAELSENYTKITQKIAQLKKRSAENSQKISEKERRLKTVLKEIETQNQLVTDAQQILDLQKSIKNYEAERKLLIAGKPCPLCGSTEHPYASHQTQGNVSKAETDLKQRQKDLDNSIGTKNRLDTEIQVLKNDQKNIRLQLSELQTEQHQILSEAQNLQLNTQITQSKHIKIQYEQALIKLEDINNQLNKAQTLQKNKDDISKTCQKYKDRLHQLEQFISAQKEKQKLNLKEIIGKQSLVEELKAKNQNITQDLVPELNRFGYHLPSVETAETFIGSVKSEINNYNSKKETLSKLENKIKLIKKEIDNTKNLINQQEKEHQKLLDQQQEIVLQLKDLRSKRAGILAFDISIDQKRKELSLKRDVLEEKQKATKKQLEDKISIKNQKETLLDKLQKEIDILKTEITKQQQTLTKQLKGSRFDSMQAVRLALLPPETKEQYQKIKKYINDRNIQITTLKKEVQQSVNQHLAEKTFDIGEADNLAKLQSLETRRETLVSETGEIKEKFRKDAEIRARNKDITKQIDAQKKVYNLWQELYKIIGGSQHAFNVYVQRLTLKQLLDLANIHLYRLNKRYSLKLPETYKTKEELNFYLVDHYQTGQMRLVETSSGGEKFIISLALALGLSDLASKNVRIDSLFIDEGFGTLDSNTLETVISTLETLQSQGKMIGIISHVEALKERIPRQIQVIKKSNGISKVEIV